jgi:diguanylate cyclase (GGDEF)-like protein
MVQAIGNTLALWGGMPLTHRPELNALPAGHHHADDPGSGSVLLLSFKHRDELADQLSAMGERVVAARRSENIASRYLSLGPRMVLVDARDAAIDALQAVEKLGPLTSAAGATMVLLYDRLDAKLVPAFAAAGITGFLASPWSSSELAGALTIAHRASSQNGKLESEGATIWWRANMESGELSVEGTSNLSPLTVLAPTAQLKDALAQFSDEDRRRAFAAMRKLRSHGGYAAFVQRAPSALPSGSVVHHLILDGQDIAGQSEWIDGAAAFSGGLGRDALTGLIDPDAAAALIAAQLGDEGGPFALSLVQLTRLENYNDIAGHAAGDVLLRSLARQLDRSARQDLGPDVMVARISGSRFAVILPGEGVAKRLDVELRALATVLNETILQPASDNLALRIATAQAEAGDHRSRLLSRLAQRLSAPRALVRTVDVERALAQAEIAVRFQPQFLSENDTLCGAEALARWHHPKLGEMGGAALFSAAAAAGLQADVSRFVWKTALAAMAQWPAPLQHLRVALNITAVDLADEGMADQLLALAARQSIATSRLSVEVTESATIGQMDCAITNLAQLRAAGVHVALDDFGTGYSGLAWLKQLPVDYIKIDSGFARDVDGAPRDRAVLGGIIDLARSLGLDVLAEGVESEEQRVKLTQMGCRWYQGFLRSPALESPDFIDFAQAALTV